MVWSKADDRGQPLLGLAEQAGDRRGDDDEGEERQKREIGEVAGVDEAVIIDADGDPLDHFERIFAGLDPAGASCPKRAFVLSEPLAPGFR